MDNQYPSKYAASSKQIAELQRLDSLCVLPESELLVLAESAVMRAVPPHGLLMEEQSLARYVFVIMSGALQQSMRDQHGNTVTLSLLGRGDLVGEGGLFGLRHRRTTARAATHSFVLQWSYNDLHMQQAKLPLFWKMLQTRFRDRLLHIALARVDFLTTLTPAERLAITEQIEHQQLERGSVLIESGSTRSEMYIIAEGQACVEQAGRTLAVLQSGDIVGEMALIDHAPHDATVIAHTPMHVLRLTHASFQTLLTEHADIAARVHDLVAQRRRIDRTPQHIALTEQFVATGVIRGRMALVRHADRCAPNCQRCVDACASRFGVARLAFSNQYAGGLEIADLCRQCQWGAECVAACPEDAFRLSRDGRWMITDQCTGCGACIPACPYNAINQRPVYPEPTSPWGWLLQRVHHAQPIGMRANKCDGCEEYANYACVDACPTNALQWIPVADLFLQADQKTQTDIIEAVS